MPKMNMVDINGQKLMEWMQSKHITIVEIAELFACEPHSVYQMLKKNRMTAKKVERLENKYNTRVPRLEEEPTNTPDTTPLDYADKTELYNTVHRAIFQAIECSGILDTLNDINENIKKLNEKWGE